MAIMKFPEFRFNIKGMISVHQGRERMDVFLTIILPLVSMVVSSWTNAWAFTGGHMVFQGPDAVATYIAILKGLFVEVQVFCFFKLVKILWTRGGWSYASSIVPFLIGLFGVILSAGCGLSSVAKSGEIDFLISSVSAYISPFIASIFKAGIGMFFPVGLAVLAVYDPKHMIEEHVESGGKLGTLALVVENAEHHQDMLRAAQKEANDDPKIKDSYKQMARINAEQAVQSARDGDYTFGLANTTVRLEPTTAVLPQPSFQRIAGSVPPTAFPGGMPQLNGPQQSFQPPFTNSPALPANYPSMGNTTPLNVPPPPFPLPVEKKGFFQQAKGFFMGDGKAS